MAEEKKDWVTPVAVGLGASAAIAGAVYFYKKPKGVDPGDIVIAKLRFKYLGDGGAYILQVSLGSIYSLPRIGSAFDHVEGLTWPLEVDLPGPDKYEFEMECPLPEAIDPKTYDGEALIRTFDMKQNVLGQWEYIIHVLTHGAINVRKE